MKKKKRNSSLENVADLVLDSQERRDEYVDSGQADVRRMEMRKLESINELRLFTSGRR